MRKKVIIFFDSFFFFVLLGVPLSFNVVRLDIFTVKKKVNWGESSYVGTILRGSNYVKL